MPRTKEPLTIEQRRKKILWGLLYLAMVSLTIATVVVQVKPDKRIVQQSQKQYWANVSVSASRGNIIDCNNIPLAVSEPVTSFYIDPQHWNPNDAKLLVPIFGKKVANKFSKQLPGRFHWVKRNIPASSAEKMMKGKKIDGLYTFTEKKRVYPGGSLGFHILGYCDIDNYGQAGIELSWNDILYSPPKSKFLTRGTKSGIIESMADDSGLISNSHAGQVKLTIDSQIQQIVENRLSEGVKSINAQWGSVVCVKPQTGEVVALASYPTIDANNRRNLMDIEATRNNVVGRVFEPGSIFKPLTMAIALDSAGVSQKSTYKCNGRIRIADKIVHDVNNKVHGILNLHQVLMKSCNIGMSLLSLKVSNYDAYGMLRELGFGEKSGIEMSGEETGLVKSPEEWLGVVPANIFIGQGIAVTPLQMVMAISCIANGGQLLKPYIVSEVYDSSGRIVYKGEKRVRQEPLSAETADFIRRGMEKVVSDGGGQRAKSELVSIAGKTGTAQIAKHGKYSKGHYAASFIGFWPSEQPEYAMLITLGEPKGRRYYGGVISAPVFKAIVEDIIQSTPQKH